MLRGAVERGARELVRVGMADDEDIYEQIKALVEEEHELDRGGQAHAQERRERLEEQLDQLWDLLRQRQARRQAGVPLPFIVVVER